MSPECEHHFDELVRVGAEGALRPFEAPWSLAALDRRWRWDDSLEHPSVVIRPLVAPDWDDEGPVFSMNDVVPFRFEVRASRVNARGNIVLVNHTAELEIRPVTGERVDHLAAWDTFRALRLSEAEIADADSLLLGSWWGAFA